jgi:hypothetical protein
MLTLFFSTVCSFHALQYPSVGEFLPTMAQVEEWNLTGGV